MWLHVGPTYRIKSLHHLVLYGLKVFYVHGGIHSVTLIVHLLSCLLATLTRPSVFAFSYVPDNVCHTTLFADPVCTPSVLQGDSLPWILSIFLWVVISFSSVVLLSDQVSQPYVIIGRKHLLNALLFSLIGAFLSRMMLSSLTECIPSLSNSPFHFLYLVLVLSYHLPEIYWPPPSSFHQQLHHRCWHACYTLL